MTIVRSISEKQLEANRRNARRSTGPKTAAGKRASRLNAVTHGLLANDVVITAGDYQEDPQAFAQLLEDLRVQFTPVGVAEDLEVQQLALYYWRNMRAVRYEHGAIRRRTVELRERERLTREQYFETERSVGLNLEGRSRGIRYLIDGLEEVKETVRNGTMPPGFHEWLVKHFPVEFVPLQKTQAGEQTAAGLVVSPDYGRRILDTIEDLLPRLAAARAKRVAIEALELDSKLRAAALPGPGVVEKLLRYETSNERALDRALRRLEDMQARRRKPGGTPAEP